MHDSNQEETISTLDNREGDSSGVGASLAASRQQALDACVICLDPISERAVAVPCNHCAFDFICIVTWVQANSTCPLCKAELTEIQYDWRSPEDFKTYAVPTTATKVAPIASYTPRRRAPGSARRGNRYRPYGFSESDHNSASSNTHLAISRRRYVYRHQLYSLHVGSNRLSCFRDFTPQIFQHNLELQSRARKWIRRELQVFDFLSVDAENTEQATQHANDRNRGRSLHDRRANNAEFLLEYVMAILRTVDIRGSSGRAQEMLTEFLGEDNAPLFLHELGAWLRSPYTSLEDWDRHVQYRVKLPGAHSQPEQPMGTRQTRASEQVEPDFELFRRRGMAARRRYEAD